MKMRLWTVAILSAGLSAGALAANQANGHAYAADNGAATVGVGRDAGLAPDQARLEYLKGVAVQYAATQGMNGRLRWVDASAAATEPSDTDAGDAQSDLNPAGIDPSNDRPEKMQPKIEGPEIQGPEVQGPVIERPTDGRPEIERPVIERPVIERPEIERPSVDR